MASFNRVVLVGNLTRDPEWRAAGSSQVANFSIAVNRRWKGGDGNQKEEVTYVDVDAWGKLADIVRDHLKKGRPVLIEGYLKQERWDAADGKKMNRMKVVAENIQFLGTPPGAGGNPNPEESEVPLEDVPF